MNSAVFQGIRSRIDVRPLDIECSLSNTAPTGDSSSGDLTAAEICDISQPALSNQIRKVEDLLNVKIFERNSRNVSLTPIGTEIVKSAESLLRSAREMDRLASNLATAGGSR